MRVFVIGAGKVGRTIVEHTCHEGHEVVVIDKNPTLIEDIIDEYDVMGVVGNGASMDIQKSANIVKADLVIAVTSSDETNILSCLIAEKLGAKSTIARVRSYEYSNQLNMIQNDLGITMTINPEAEAANEIAKVLNFPEAIRVESFANGNVDLIELFIPNDSPLIGESLISMYKKYQIKVLVCAIQRNEEVFIPKGDYIFQAKDRIHITANSKETLRLFLEKSCLIESKIKNVMMIGGGKISTYLGKELVSSKIKTKIIEKDLERCNELSQLLPKVSIINGDGSDQNVLEEEGLLTTDAIISLTGSDEENIIISLFAQKQKVKKIISKINKSSLADLVSNISMATVISPKDITANKIISYIRANTNKRGSNVITLYKLVNNKVEALEFLAKEDKKINNIPLKDLKLKPNILIAGIIRNNDVIIPSGSDVILANDSVIVVTTNSGLEDLKGILE